MRDTRDVEPARCHIGGAQDLRVSALKAVERPLALRLALIAVDRLRLKAFLNERLRELFNTVLGAAEDEHFVEVGLDEQIVKHINLVAASDTDDVLLDAFCRLFSFDGYRDRIFQVVLDEALYLARHGRREEEGVARGRQKRQNVGNRLDKAHVEHAVCFVEHHALRAVEFEHAAVDQVFEAARSADDEVVVILKVAHLSADVGTADAKRRVEFEPRAKFLELVFDLHRELAGRRHDERACVRVVDKLVDERDQERCGLAGAGVGDAHNVLAHEDVRDSLVLNRSWVCVAVARDVVLERRRDIEVCECVRRLVGR